MIPAFLADRENRKRRGELDKENRVGAVIGNLDYADFTDDLDEFDEDDEVVLETKGSSPPPAPSPMSEAQAQIALERERALLQQQAAERQRQLEEQQRQERIQKARGLQSQAYNSALDYGQEQIAGRGFDAGLVDQYNLLDMYSGAIDRTKLGIAEDDLNPMAAYNTRTSFNDALDTALGAYRGDLRRSINSVAGDGFEYNLFADTADDEILHSILDSRKNDALSQIDMAKARGQLNDTGYGRAIERLGQQGESAMADLQDLGLGVLSNYRKDLTGMRDNELTKVGSLDFSNPYSMDGFQNRLNTRVSDFSNRMRGDLFRATEGQSFFDPSTIISGSGAVQGYYNPTTQKAQAQGGAGANPLLDAFTQQNQQQQRQPGTNGVF